MSVCVVTFNGIFLSMYVFTLELELYMKFKKKVRYEDRIISQQNWDFFKSIYRSLITIVF